MKVRGKMENNGKLVYSVKEVAGILNLSRNSVYSACLSGEIPCLRIGKRILIPKIRLEQILHGNSNREKQII